MFDFWPVYSGEQFRASWPSCSYFSSKPYVVTAHLNRLVEMVQMKGHSIQGGHALWKTGKMVKKKSLQGKIMEFEILLKIREKSGNFKKILSL